MPFKIDSGEYTFDTAAPGTLGAPVPVPDKAAAGSTDGDPNPRDTSGWDLTKETKLTLAQYLSRLTLGKEGSAKKSNEFPIDYETTYPEETKLETPAGAPAPLADGKNASRFAADRTGNSRGSEGLKTVSDDAAKLLPLDGNVPDTLTKQEPYVSAVLKHNRFSAGQKFSDEQTVSLYTEQYNERGESKRHVVPVNQLATVGTTLSLRSTLTVNSQKPDLDPRSAAAEALALIPSTNQLLVERIAPDMLRAKQVLDAFVNDPIQSYPVPDDAMVSISPGGSWGQLNNVYTQFSGFSAVGMMALSTSLTTALMLTLTGFYALLGGVMDKAQGGNLSAAKDASGRYTLGSYMSPPGRTSQALKIFNLEMLGIRPTHNPISRCTLVGAGAFFGFGDVGRLTGNPSDSNVLQGFIDIAESPGYNAVIARNIIRSGQVIAERVKAISTQNGLGVAKGVLDIVELLRSSKIIGAINIFAKIGDQILQDQSVSSSPNQSRDLTSILGGLLDEPSDEASHSSARIRLNNSLKLAYSSNRAPAMYLVPERLQADMLANRVGGPVVVDRLSRTQVNILSEGNQQDGARIDKRTREKFESDLESEYMPFYFHDLRTNEIISFHAFLSTLSDDYNVDWNTEDGYGRVEQVKIYKSTSRRLNVSFYVASTSPTDFDEMWVKINKLTTMLYPQYTQGKQMLTDEKGTYTFTQPFSQLIGASPVIRLRIGDYIRSNYSRFALKRLFGYGDTMKLQTSTGQSVDVNYLKKVEGVKDTIVNAARTAAVTAKVFQSAVNDYEFYIPPGMWPLNASTLGKTIGFGAAENSVVLDTNVLTQSTSFVVRLKDVSLDPSSAGMAICKVVANVAPDEVDQFDIKRYGSKAPSVRKLLDGEYKIPIGLLVPTKKTVNAFIADIRKNDNPGDVLSQDQQDALKDFFSYEKNAVVKSFEDVGGKGLAGVIESLNIGELERVPWEIDQGSKAPMACKITLSFHVIHDVSPGLDHKGFNRAPTYQVGKMMNTDVQSLLDK